MTAVVADSRPERAARPVLLTVDDDPSVSRAVARDLRRRYGADYRIMRADSGEEALQAIRDVVLRGEQVAAILADYRMPRMNGVDFLEQAMDLVPQARRAPCKYCNRFIIKGAPILLNAISHADRFFVNQ